MEGTFLSSKFFLTNSGGRTLAEFAEHAADSAKEQYWRSADWSKPYFVLSYMRYDLTLS